MSLLRAQQQTAAGVAARPSRPEPRSSESLHCEYCRGKTTVDLPVYFIYECRAYEIVKWEINKLILCDTSAFEQEYSQVCL